MGKKRLEKRIKKLNIKGAKDPEREKKFQEQSGYEEKALLPQSFVDSFNKKKKEWPNVQNKYQKKADKLTEKKRRKYGDYSN